MLNLPFKVLQHLSKSILGLREDDKNCVTAFEQTLSINSFALDWCIYLNNALSTTQRSFIQAQLKGQDQNHFSNFRKYYPGILYLPILNLN